MMRKYKLQEIKPFTVTKQPNDRLLTVTLVVQSPLPPPLPLHQKQLTVHHQHQISPSHLSHN